MNYQELQYALAPIMAKLDDLYAENRKMVAENRYDRNQAKSNQEMIDQMEAKQSELCVQYWSSENEANRNH